MKTVIRKVRSFARLTYDSFFCRRHKDKVILGSRCPWNILKTGLDSNMVVISGGVGNDMSFELEIANRYGCRVELFDPSPTGIATASKKENQNRLIKFHAKGLAKNCGYIPFSPPTNPSEGSYRTNVGNSTIDFECISIPELLKMESKDQKLFLKLDIEGFEYEILSSLSNKELNRFEQICLEFHHFLPGFTRDQTKAIIDKLKSTGFKIMHKNRCDYLFVNKRLLK